MIFIFNIIFLNWENTTYAIRRHIYENRDSWDGALSDVFGGFQPVLSADTGSWLYY